MIEKVLKPPKKAFGGIAFLRIKALFDTYGENIELYIQRVNGRITALFGAYQSGFSLCAEPLADYNELQSFFSLLRAEVFCEAHVAEKICGFRKTECNIVRLTEALSGNVSHAKISNVYFALQKGEDGDISLPPFDLWYTDFCLRFNHNAAEYALTENAVAVCGFMTEKASLITGVAIDPEKRGKGLGKKAVADLVTAIKQKYNKSEIFAACTDEKLPFYEKCGFSYCEKCAVLRYGSV